MQLLCFPSFQTHLPLQPVTLASSLAHQSEWSPSFCPHSHSRLHSWVVQNAVRPTPSREIVSLSQSIWSSWELHQSVFPHCIDMLPCSMYILRDLQIRSWVTQSDQASHLNQQRRETPMNRNEEQTASKIQSELEPLLVQEIRFAYGPADATATPSSLASVKSRKVYLSGAGLLRLSWKKRPLNVCVCVCGQTGLVSLGRQPV